VRPALPLGGPEDNQSVLLDITPIAINTHSISTLRSGLEYILLHKLSGTILHPVVYANLVPLRSSDGTIRAQRHT